MYFINLKLLTYLLFTLRKKSNLHLYYFVGAYVPLTMEGNIIVDGVLASCYPEYFDHNLAHLLMIPMQTFSNLWSRYLELTLDFQYLLALQESWACSYSQMIGITDSSHCKTKLMK